MYNKSFKQMNFTSYHQLPESLLSDSNRKANISVTHHYDW